MDGNTLDTLDRVPDDETAESLPAGNAPPRRVAPMLPTRPLMDENALLAAGGERSAGPGRLLEELR